MRKFRREMHMIHEKSIRGAERDVRNVKTKIKAAHGGMPDRPVFFRYFAYRLPGPMTVKPRHCGI